MIVFATYHWGLYKFITFSSHAIMVSVDSLTCLWSTAHGVRFILNQGVFNNLKAPITSFGCRSRPLTVTNLKQLTVWDNTWYLSCITSPNLLTHWTQFPASRQIKLHIYTVVTAIVVYFLLSQLHHSYQAMQKQHSLLWIMAISTFFAQKP